MKWIGPGKTTEQFKQTHAYCLQNINEYTELDDEAAYRTGQGIGSGSAGLAGLGMLALSLSQQNKEARFMSCMNQNGYRWVPK